MTEQRTITVDLGGQEETLNERMATGRYSSPSEVVQEALQALEREDALLEELMEDKMQAALEEPGIEPPAAEAESPRHRVGTGVSPR